MFYDQIKSNKRKTVVLVLFFMIFVGLIAYAASFFLIGGFWALPFAIGIVIVLTWISYWNSAKVALAVSRAKPADPEQYARLHNVVEGLCIAAGLPKPAVYVVDDPAPNAFATGRNPEHAAIAVTTGLLQKMNRIELEGVLAHELSHIRNYDTLVMTIAVTMVGISIILADLALRMMWFGGGRRRSDSGPAAGVFMVVGLLALIVAPIVAKILQFSISRRREALADMSAVELTRYPPGLISALEKLRDDDSVVHSATRATAHLWIEEPLEQDAERGGKWTKLNKLFATHPPIEERIEALREL